jgi:hypothetical protein
VGGGEDGELRELISKTRAVNRLALLSRTRREWSQELEALMALR